MAKHLPSADARIPLPRTYALEFSDHQWNEIEALGFAPFEPVRGESLTRPQWMAVGTMALGKAQRIDDGDYGMVKGQPADDDLEAVGDWAEDLRDVAAIIFEKFQSGDGQI